MGKPAPIEGVDRDTALDEAGRRSITTRLGEVMRYQERLVGAVDPDEVHDLRVATRRLRAALTANGKDNQAILTNSRDTSFVGTADNVTDEEVISAIRSVPCHY